MSSKGLRRNSLKSRPHGRDRRSASGFAGFHQSRGKIWLALTEKTRFLSGRPMPCMILRVKQLSEIRIFFTARIFSFGNLCLCHKNLYAERCYMEFHRNGIKWYRNFIEGEIRFYRKSVGNRKKKLLHSKVVLWHSVFW